MSPFADNLRKLRLQCGLRQAELAALLGYEQSYVSSLEIGTKGPPTQEFVDKLLQIIDMSGGEREQLLESVAASQKKITLPDQAPAELYWLMYKLRQQLDCLHPVQIELIEMALSLPVDLTKNLESKPSRVRRRDYGTTKTEAKM